MKRRDFLKLAGAAYLVYLAVRALRAVPTTSGPTTPPPVAGLARTFADARPGDVILYEDSYRNMSVAINRGNAAAMLHAAPGQRLVIRVLGPAVSVR